MRNVDKLVLDSRAFLETYAQDWYNAWLEARRRRAGWEARGEVVARVAALTALPDVHALSALLGA